VTSISPDAQRVWRVTRGPAVVLLVIIAVSVVVAIVRGSDTVAPLDPGSVNPDGSRALARLLRAQGVQIATVRTTAAAERQAAGATVLVTRPDLVPPSHLDVLSERAGDLILIAPGQDTVDAVAPGTRTDGTVETTDRAPGCRLADATASGTATMGGRTYQSSTTACYDDTLSTQDTLTLLGTDAPLTNDRLDEQGNAALAMRLLGRHHKLVWFIPSPTDPALRPSRRPITELIPDGVGFGLLQLAIAVALLALWRARRLGPVVTEPLPVVVRAAETVEGRARLYRRAGAADHAGEALRQATRDRLRAKLGTPDLAAEVARRTGRHDIDTLLHGPPVAGEAELVALADALDALENEVGRT
jgi:hypothetical protein